MSLNKYINFDVMNSIPGVGGDGEYLDSYISQRKIKLAPAVTRLTVHSYSVLRCHMF